MLSTIGQKFFQCMLILFSISSSVLEKTFLLGFGKISVDDNVAGVALSNNVSRSLPITTSGSNKTYFVEFPQ